MATKSGAQDARLTSLFKALAELFPSLAVDPAQIGSAWGMLSRGNSGEHPSLATQDGCRASCLAAGGTPLVVALRAEFMLKVVVGARQIRDSVAVEQPGAVAAGDLAEMVDGAAEGACAVAVAGHGAEQPVETALQRGGILGVVVVQDMGRFVHPWIDPLDVGPQRGGPLQTPLDQILQARERRRTAPFCATRSRLPATASSRPLSFRPAAASGGWPSSVMALRTAAQ